MTKRLGHKARSAAATSLLPLLRDGTPLNSYTEASSRCGVHCTLHKQGIWFLCYLGRSIIQMWGFYATWGEANDASFHTGPNAVAWSQQGLHHFHLHQTRNINSFKKIVFFFNKSHSSCSIKYLYIYVPIESEDCKTPSFCYFFVTFFLISLTITRSASRPVMN